MIPANRQESFQQFVKNIKDGYYYSYNPTEWDRCIHYLENGDDTYTPNAGILDNWNMHYLWELLSHPNQWDSLDDRIIHLAAALSKQPAAKKSYYITAERIVNTWVHKVEPYYDLVALESMSQILKQHNISVGYLGSSLYHNLVADNIITAAGQFVLGVTDILIQEKHSLNHYQYFNFLLAHNETALEKNLDKFIYSPKRDSIFGFHNINALLNHNPSKYEDFAVQLYKKATDKMEAIQIVFMLSQHFSSKYDSEILNLAHQYLQSTKDKFDHADFRFDWYYQPNSQSCYFITIVLDILLQKESPDKVFSIISDFFKGAPSIPFDVLNFVHEKLGESSLPILINALSKSGADVKQILDLIKKYSHEDYYPLIWSMIPKADKRNRSAIARHLATVLGDEAIPNAEKLLQDKKADLRLVGAMILSFIKSEKALDILRGLLNSEKNDDARDAMLEGLAGLISNEASYPAIQEAINQADTRDKLSKPLTEWLNTEGGKYPKTYWKSGEEIDNKALQFLFYRMNRVKDIRIDVEAKPFIALIDTSQSAPFAKVLLKNFFENGADSKLKWCMTLASILGGDDEIDALKRKVNEWVDASRGKMAEYAVKALALNGSTKALRAVEFFSRKYKSKNKNIGAAAVESFAIAAEELGITPYDLADSIIPDFGFEGLFKTFEVNGDTFRAFINNDFKIAFLNDDNKLLKSPPKGTSKEIQDEFKEIAKEVRDIVKSQSSRLEQYLVIQRKWSIEKWDAFFRGNPIMFAYAVRSIWGIFDEKQNLVTTFQCLEDQTLVNIEGDELDLDEYTEGGYQIGMVHPMMLAETEINHWKEALYDAEVQPIFPQLDRPVILLQEENKNTKISTEFNGIEYGGYGFIGKMEKLGWFRGSVVDAGGISSYYKDFSELGITAIVTQEGCLSVGYYEENAILGNLMFVKNKSVSFGSYTYDEPSKNDDERLVALSNVPPIVYSEVMADMLFFKENQVKKEEN